ncbi:hypothetical protein DFH06DRAFT_1138389 [Mycena polygramma]|nr:hypothetical protein DFH06DRAFT_1138389 [Mycena polygramma]
MIAFTISTNLTTAALLIFTTSAVIGLGTLFTQFPALIRLWLAHRCDYAAENRIEVDEVRFRRHTQDSFGLVLAFWGLLDRTEAVLSRLSGRYDSETQIIILTEALDERKSETSRLLSNIEDTMDAWEQQNKANSQKQEAQNKLLQAQMKRCGRKSSRGDRLDGNHGAGAYGGSVDGALYNHGCTVFEYAFSSRLLMITWKPRCTICAGAG